jgi:hypothetical protein
LLEFGGVGSHAAELCDEGVKSLVGHQRGAGAVGSVGLADLVAERFDGSGRHKL